MSKIETLSAEKLHRLNMMLNDLAEAYDVQLYDGWDIGPFYAARSNVRGLNGYGMKCLVANCGNTQVRSEGGRLQNDLAMSAWNLRR